MVKKGKKMKGKKAKAYWHGYEIYEIDYHSHSGWCEILFVMNGYASPITGTGRYRVLMEDIEIREEE